jgi:hypothetical protein
MIASAKGRALKNGLAFNLVPRDVVIPKRCPVLGIRLVAGDRSRKDASPSLDRINNSRGYVPGNVAVISWRANRIKGDATVDELAAVVRYLRKHHRRKKRQTK